MRVEIGRSRLIDYRAEVNRRGPGAERAEPFALIVGLCKDRGRAQDRSEAERPSALQKSPASQSSQSARSTDQNSPAMCTHPSLPLLRYSALRLPQSPTVPL